MTEIKKVAVFGSGVMGKGIARVVAEKGDVEVLLFDIIPQGGFLEMLKEKHGEEAVKNHNILADNAIDNIVAAMLKEEARRREKKGLTVMSFTEEQAIEGRIRKNIKPANSAMILKN